jgi:hypothetical protein
MHVASSSANGHLRIVDVLVFEEVLSSVLLRMTKIGYSTAVSFRLVFKKKKDFEPNFKTFSFNNGRERRARVRPRAG